MKGPKLIINIVLSICVIAMGYYLYLIIQEPIIFEKEKGIRKDAAVAKLKDIRQAQIAYKDLNGKFAANFNALINTLVNDSFPLIKAIGEAPDSLTEEQATAQGLIIRDTTLIPMIAHAFPPPKEYLDNLNGYANEMRAYVDSMAQHIKQLPAIPFSDGKNFDINAGEINKNRVTIQVFEISASESDYLNGLATKYINDSYRLRVGSMIEGTYTGNWE